MVTNIYLQFVYPALNVRLESACADLENYVLGNLNILY